MFFLGVYIALNIPLPIEIFGVEWVSQTTGWNMLVIGLFGAIARTTGGRLYDYTGNATFCFLYGGSVQILAATLFSTKVIISRIRNKHKTIDIYLKEKEKA